MAHPLSEQRVWNHPAAATPCRGLVVSVCQPKPLPAAPRPSPPAGKGAKREAEAKPAAAKEPAKKAKKEGSAKKEAPTKKAPQEAPAAPAGDVEMKDEQGVVGSGRAAAQVRS